VSSILAGPAGLAWRRPLGSVPTCTCWAAMRRKTANSQDQAEPGV